MGAHLPSSARTGGNGRLGAQVPSCCEQRVHHLHRLYPDRIVKQDLNGISFRRWLTYAQSWIGQGCCCEGHTVVLDQPHSLGHVSATRRDDKAMSRNV